MTSIKCGGGYIYTIPQTKIEYIGYFYASLGKESIKSAYKRITEIRGREPDILMNAEYFDFITRKAASDVVSGGEVHRLTETFGIAFPENKEAVFCYKNNVNAKDYVGGYPTLIRNGEAENAPIPSGVGGSRGRTALGVGRGNLYVALIPDGLSDVTLPTLTNALLNAGATDAINLDGGGSTQFYAPNGNYFSGRNVRGYIGIWFKKEENNTPKKHKVFLSFGHGGKDNGASGYGLIEKDINLTMGLTCKMELERHGVEVICSRLVDEDDRVADEVKEANASGVELALAIHNNAGKGDGFEAYYWSTNKQDKKLASLCEKYVKEIGQNSRGIKIGNDLYWCHYTNMTSCLVEGFFLDNDTDNDIADMIAEQKRFGVAYAKAILEYLGIEYKADITNENAEIITVLYDAGILSDKELWLEKISTDKNCYWLMKKMCDYIKGGK